MTLYRGTVLDTPESPFEGGRLRAEDDAGIAGIEGKQPATIAVSVAAGLLQRLEREAAAPAAGGTRPREAAS